MVDRARDGKPQTGARRYGYTKTGMEIVAEEAAIVRWMFESFLNGMTPHAISDDLNRRGIPTAQGKRWSIPTVLRLLDSRHVAGIRVFRGREWGPGSGPRSLTPRCSAKIQRRRALSGRQPPATSTSTARSTCCGACCGAPNAARGCRVGPTPGGRPVYVCTNFRPTDGSAKCYRRAGAASLESFIKDAAITLLERLDVTGAATTAMLTDDDKAAIEADQAELAELKAMWDTQEIKTHEYRAMRKRLQDRIDKRQAKTIIRPGVEVLDQDDRAGRPENLGRARASRELRTAERRAPVPVRGDRLDESRAANGRFRLRPHPHRAKRPMTGLDVSRS